MTAIWVDDVNSTGSSLTEGCETLEADYNIRVKMAVYLVDRSVDRANLAPEKCWLARPRYVEGHTKIRALMDLAEIDPLVPDV